jgi:precorrin-8X/cobalt-precorrin-8 methylmutase
MTHTTGCPGIIVISHGSPRGEANRGFVTLVERVAARLGAEHVLPAFFSIASPTIADQVAELASRGVRRIVLQPYFLYSGQHVTADIPALLADCRRQFPNVDCELLPTLENDPALEDLVVERLAALSAPGGMLPGDPAGIEQRSFQIIDCRLGASGLEDAGVRTIVRRVVHATADFSYAHTLRVHATAVAAGSAALAAGRPILCDVKMLQAGITRVRNEVLCAIDRADVATRARQQNTTRAAIAMDTLAPQLDGAIVAVGNAPTALWRVLELVRNGGPRPALVVGLPVGLVGAREAKQALLESDLCYVTNIGPRGGSPVAAAVVNALAGLTQRE